MAESSYFQHSRCIWQPSQPQWSSIETLRCMINRKHGLNLQNIHDLWEYSVTSYEFWKDLWEDNNIIYSVAPSSIISPGSIPELPAWFPGARLNYAENLLYRNDDGIACTTANEQGNVVDYTFRQLRQMVREMAGALRVHGLKAGDRVAAIVANSIHAVVIALAAHSIGALFSSTSPDMGAQGILDRYRQITPKFVFTETEVLYAGRRIDLISTVADVVKGLSQHGVSKTILLPPSSGRAVSVDLPNVESLKTFLAASDGRELTFEQLPFDHPIYILYSSGTSGPPKCIVHSAGGVLLQVKKELRLTFDLKPNETYFQYTTTGWMMWASMVTALSCGCRIVLYDGSPFYPDVNNYLKFVNDNCITVLGTSPRFLSEVQGRGIKPLTLGPFTTLKKLLVTGAVITPPLFEWTQAAFGERVHVVSTSGGTDVCTSFVTGCPSLPVHTGEIQMKSLGMKVEILDPSGNNVEELGQPGELCCTRPHPSLPKFWNDTENHAKLRETYFSMYPGIWRQGDFIVYNPVTKGLIILGRSDGVLNPSGVRFGSGEIYTVLEKFVSVIDDSLCVGQRRERDEHERVILFLKMRSGHKLTKVLDGQIRREIRQALSPRHVPAYVFPIEEIPYTVNGKKIEIAVKQILSGYKLKPSGTVANPESLKLYYKFQDIEKVVGEKPKL